MHRTAFFALALLFALAAPTWSPAAGNQLLIRENATVTVTGDALILYCNALVIESGGSLTLDGGNVVRAGPATIAPGGRVDYGNGTISRCAHPWLLLLGDS